MKKLVIKTLKCENIISTYIKFSNLYRLIFLSLGIVLVISWTQQQVYGYTPIKNKSVVDTNGKKLIAKTPKIKPKSITIKKALNKLYIKPNETISLVIKLSDRRVYVYKNDQLKTSYPIAIGKEGWETPTGTHKVIQKIPNPSWTHPFTGEIIPPGPENPLGERWIGFWTDGTNYIGFHGTPNEETVGQAASHGCVRMFNQDVLDLFEKVTIGTIVVVEP
ncbi:ErfK/YbiS/YcfS/YnhG [Trichodesmium erythraeum IMS101]|uniref:ErfK/YbiS/YcfS/YnhG n=1 Tax=Trichodesmium erythraeum (strain IMS101) TaxID=203124 RepID=Q113G6_TRIEI|nr:L,D-transpeptidase [Trichodesmium erythraeum GBRTRLIN201]MCH2047429.1 L,D-transpeptidase [Trichodesmium sp. ALOHA_ZT_67]